MNCGEGMPLKTDWLSISLAKEPYLRVMRLPEMKITCIHAMI